MLRAAARRVLPLGTRRALERWLGLDHDVSSGFEILLDDVHPKLLLGWKDRRMRKRLERRGPDQVVESPLPIYRNGLLAGHDRPGPSA